MKNSIAWVLLGVLLLLLLLFLAVLPARRGQETAAPTPVVQVTPRALATVPTATPTALTPAQEDLEDLNTETVALDADADLDTDLTGLEQELQGL